MRYPNLFFNIM